MARQFTGWSTDAYSVLLRLEGAPSQKTMDEVRYARERNVRGPMIDLLDELAWVDSFYENHSVWRFGRTSFWWQNQCAIVRVGPSVELGFRFNLDGLRVQAVWDYAPQNQVIRYRAAVAENGSGQELTQLLDHLVGANHMVVGHQLARTPGAYEKDHPRAELLRHRSLRVGKSIDTEELRDSAPVQLICQELRPLLGWLTRYTHDDGQ